MSKEEVASIMTYCKEKSISYKSHLDELGIPFWRFYDSRRHYADEEPRSGPGEFLQLQPDGAFTQMPSFKRRGERSLRQHQSHRIHLLHPQAI